MATNTPNYNLSKPDSTDDMTDFFADYGDNMEIIDSNMGGGGGNANQNIADDYDDTLTYSVGDYVIYNDLLYKCETDVTVAETFDPIKWTHVLVTDEMGGGGGSGGHTIIDENDTSMTQRTGLQFTGNVSVTDDAVNDKTIVDIQGGIAHHYSDNETIIGTWFGETLYERTLKPAVSTGDNTLNHGIANLKECVHIFGKCRYNNTSEVLPLPYVSKNIQYAISLGNVTATTYLIGVGVSFSSIQDCYVTIQYTKTS